VKEETLPSQVDWIWGLVVDERRREGQYKTTVQKGRLEQKPYETNEGGNKTLQNY